MKHDFKNIPFLNSILTAIILGIGGLLVNAFGLNFAGVIIDYLFESTLLIGATAVVVAIIASDIYAYKSEKMKERLKASEDECNSYKKRFEEQKEIERETKQLRSVIKYKKIRKEKKSG